MSATPDEATASERAWLSHQLMEPAFRHAFNSILLTDADYSDGGPHIVAVNDAFCRMTGYTEQELLGKSPRILQGPDTDPEVIARLARNIREGEFFVGRTVNYRKDGTPYNVEWNISPRLRERANRRLPLDPTGPVRADRCRARSCALHDGR